MAEEAKPAAPSRSLLADLVYLLAGLYILAALFNRVADYIYFYLVGNKPGSLYLAMADFFIHDVRPVLTVLALIVSIAAIYGIISTYKKLNAIVKEEKELYSLQDVPLPIGAEYAEKKNESWEAVLNHINSANSSDWRLAIIEADIMLDDLLRAAGYHGETTGEMLKAVEKSDFTSIEQAWEAHKIRNRIAHSGSRFPLNEREAKRAIALYEEVFKEFKII